MFTEITPSGVDYTVGQLALLEASGHDAGALASAYADAVIRDDADLEQELALRIELDFNDLFYS